MKVQVSISVFAKERCAVEYKETQRETKENKGNASNLEDQDGDDKISYLICRDMQISISVQRDTLVIALQSNFQLDTINYGVVRSGRLKNLGLVRGWEIDTAVRVALAVTIGREAAENCICGSSVFVSYSPENVTCRCYFCEISQQLATRIM